MSNLTNILERLKNLEEITGKLSYAGKNMYEHLNGDANVNMNKADDAPMPSGILNEINTMLNKIDANIGSLDETVNKLHTIIS